MDVRSNERSLAVADSPARRRSDHFAPTEGRGRATTTVTNISRLNSCGSASLTLLTLAFLLALIPSDGQAQTEAAETGSTKQMLEQCVAIKTLSPAYCQCAIAVSETLTDNRQMFLAYVAATANNGDKARTLYDEIIDGSTLDKYNFSSKQERTDYVEGKARVFEHRLTTLCANK